MQDSSANPNPGAKIDAKAALLQYRYKQASVMKPVGSNSSIRSKRKEDDADDEDELVQDFLDYKHNESDDEAVDEAALSVTSYMSSTELLSKLLMGRNVPSAYQLLLKERVSHRDAGILSIITKAQSSSNPNETLRKLNDSLSAPLYTEFRRLFETCSTTKAKKVAQSERLRKSLHGTNFVYGEVPFKTFASFMLRSVSFPADGGLFYDLGAGTGRGIFAAALLHNFKRCIGVEILHNLYDKSLEILERWRDTHSPEQLEAQQISLNRGDLRTFDWSDGDVVFANSTCFDDELIEWMSLLGEKLKKGAYVVTFTKRLTSPHFKLLACDQYDMSWGTTSVYTHLKILDSTLSDPSLASKPLPPLPLLMRVSPQDGHSLLNQSAASEATVAIT